MAPRASLKKIPSKCRELISMLGILRVPSDKLADERRLSGVQRVPPVSLRLEGEFSSMVTIFQIVTKVQNSKAEIN